jgi:hypothetical protein
MDGGWDLVLWAGEPFDYSTPFREMLAGIAGILNLDAPASIELPTYEEYEDFVEGTLQFGDETIRAYYEHSLSYLVLMSDSADTLRKVADRLAPFMQIA